MIGTFVMMELARQLTWSEEPARLHHYRAKDRVEVDAVLETPDGRVIAIEVKAGATVRTEDLAGLRHLANRLGSRFVAGYVLYTRAANPPVRRTPARPPDRRSLARRPIATGSASLSRSVRGPKPRAVPVSALWQI